MNATKAQLADIGEHILNWEARRDAKKCLAVYRLPLGDGGGSYEVAGINEKYNPAKAKELKELIESGKYEQAEIEASQFIINETNSVAAWTMVVAVEAFLRDSCFNRGKSGAAKIYQMALNVHVDGDVGTETLKAARTAERDPKQLLQSLRAAREEYERKVVKRDETSKFWKGLVNRWNNAMKYSLSLLK